MTIRTPARLRSAASNTPIRLASLVVVAAAGTLLTACGAGTSPTGGSGNGGQSSNAGSQSGSQSGSGGGTGISDGLGHPVNVCSLLPADTAASISGEPISLTTEDDTPSIKLYKCKYTSTDGTEGFDVSVLADDAVPGYDNEVNVEGSSGHVITGLGDKAFSGILGLKALFGNVSIDVSNLQSDSAAENLIRALQPKL